MKILKHKKTVAIIIFVISIFVLLGLKLFFKQNDPKTNEFCDKVVHNYQKIFEYTEKIDENTSKAFFDFASSLSRVDDSISSCNLVSYSRLNTNRYQVNIRCMDHKEKDEMYYVAEVYSRGNSLYYIESSIRQSCKSSLSDTYNNDTKKLREFVVSLKEKSLGDDNIDINTDWYMINKSATSRNKNNSSNYVISQTDEISYKSLGLDEMCIECDIGPIFAYAKYEDNYYINTTVVKSEVNDESTVLKSKVSPDSFEELNDLNSIFNSATTLIMTENGNGVIFSNYCTHNYPDRGGMNNYYTSVVNIGECLMVN